MCRSLVDIQSETAEIKRGKKENRNKTKMSASATQGGHNYYVWQIFSSLTNNQPPSFCNSGTAVLPVGYFFAEKNTEGGIYKVVS